MPNKLSDLEVDEISLVYKGANQHSRVAIAKSLDGQQEETVEIFDQAGNPVDPDDLEVGDVVFDSEGNAYQYDLEDDDTQELDMAEEVRQPEPVGKSAPKSKFAEDFRVQLSKAMTDNQRDEVFAKAVDYVSYLEEVAKNAEATAQSEREIRRQSEYLEIAKSYSLPVPDEDLAAAMMAIEDNVDPRHVELISKCLSAASDALFQEVGQQGGNANSAMMDQIESYANSQVQKMDISQAELISKTFESNPSLYDRYLADNGPYNR